MKSSIKLKNGSATIHSMNYSTTVDNFKIIGYNRGKETGYDENRVKGLMELMTTEDFIWLLSTIKVIYRKKSKLLIVLDGANRITAVRFLIENGVLPANFEIPFTLIEDKFFDNTTDKELIDFISIINEYDPRWKEAEHFDAASASKLLTATMFGIYVSKFKAERENLKYEKDFRVRNVPLKLNVLLSLATKKPIAHGVSSLKYKDFRDDNIGNYMKSDEFKNDFESLIKFLKIVKEWHGNKEMRISKSIFAAMSIIYHENIKVSFSYLVGELEKTNRMPQSESNIKSFLSNLITE